MLKNIFFVIFLVGNAGFLFNVYRHINETIVIKNFLEEHGIATIQSGLSKELAVRVSDIVRGEFNVNRESWKNLPKTGYGFFGAPADFLLNHKEGLCGEGARVIVRLLQSLGYDATRISLRTPRLGNTGHVAVSVMVDGREFFIDTINSGAWFNELVRGYDIDAHCYPLVTYLQRKDLSRYQKKIPFYCNRLIQEYPIYSYDAVPYRKLFELARLDVYVINFDRPSKLVSYLAESVYLMYAIVFAMVSLLSGGSVIVLKRKYGKR